MSERQGGPIPDYAPYTSASGNGAQAYNPYALSQPWNPYSFQAMKPAEHPSEPNPDSQYSSPHSSKGNSQAHHTAWSPAPPASQAQWPSGSQMSAPWSSPTQPPAHSGYNPWASAPQAASSHSYPPPSATFPHVSSYTPPSQTFSPPPPTYSPKYPPKNPSKIPGKFLQFFNILLIPIQRVLPLKPIRRYATLISSVNCLNAWLLEVSNSFFI